MRALRASKSCLVWVAGAALLISCASWPKGLSGTRPVDPYAQDTRDRVRLPTAPVTTLERADVDRFLANGPGWFIQQVDLVSANAGPHFVGFRVMRFFEGDRRFSAVDIKPGDVVVRVNDMPIGRPEQFMKVWEDMKIAKQLTVEYIRGGSVRFLRWEIREEGALEEEVVVEES